MSQTLLSVLKSVDWGGNIDASFGDKEQSTPVEEALYRVAVWSKQLETVDESNPAICFVREMQTAAQQCSALIGLGIYKASAASARAMLETALYYTYFRTHPDELATLTRVERYYLSKSDVLDFHRLHTPQFMKRQEIFGLIGNLDAWYSKISAVIHGQVPGAWNSHSSLDSISFDKSAYDLAVGAFTSGELLLHQVLLCTVGHSNWDSFASGAKTRLLKGIPGAKKDLLALDAK